MRAQKFRLRRKKSEIAANSLSFEEDAIFASGDEGSSPSSGALLESLATQEDECEIEGWGEGWEEEYRRAVEDEGGPDDLVMGLLDEEEDERKKWELKRRTAAEVKKALASQWRGKRRIGVFLVYHSICRNRCTTSRNGCT